MSNTKPTSYSRKLRDIAGQSFGQWTVLYRTDNVRTFVMWMCRCQCGIMKPVKSTSLTTGASRSCKECVVRRSIPNRQSPEYVVWLSMRNRCNNPRARGYENYGGRGIAVDPLWNSFDVFYRDMGHRPTVRHTIDRIDNDRGYSKSNCRWATRGENSRNTRRTRMFTFNNRTMCIADWAKHLNMNPVTLLYRINHWTLQDALTPLSK